jgi:23S rRNA (adenine2503-C2)-methyltransferase
MQNELSGLLPEQLTAHCIPGPSYRGIQLFRGIHHALLTDIEGITTLPVPLRNELKQRFHAVSSALTGRAEDNDGTVKLTMTLYDGRIIETVLLADNTGRKTGCISTQHGCPMGCTFCKTGSMPDYRNLSAGEIVEQVNTLRREYGKLSNIVFMGMGEPLLNLEAVRQAVEILHHREGADIGYRKMTLSTCGLVDGIADLAEHGPPVRLAVSLTTAREKLRSELMPVNLSNPLPALKEALLFYQKKQGKRITLEYVLFGHVNDTAADVSALTAFTEGMETIVNIIPYNRVPETAFQEPSAKRVNTFSALLNERGVKATVRYSRGRGVNGACGMLGGTMSSHVLNDGPNAAHP